MKLCCATLICALCLQVLRLEVHPVVAQSLNNGNNNNKLWQRSASPLMRTRQAATVKPPEFAEPIGNVTAVVGRDARLVCTVDNLGAHQVAWLKMEPKTIMSIDTNIIITNYRIFLIPDEEERKWVLYIRDVQVSDRGFYQCQVNTQPMKSIAGHLEVFVPPTLVEAQTSQVVESDELANVSLQCKFNGQPKPSVSWRRDDGQPIRLIGGEQHPTVTASTTYSSIRTSFELLAQQQQQQQSQTTNPPLLASDSSLVVDEVRSERLSFTKVDKSMSGIYVCTGSNGIPPYATKRIPLYVKFAPRAFVQNKFVSVSLSEQLSIDCFVEAFPRANSFWSRADLSPSNSAGFKSGQVYAGRTRFKKRVMFASGTTVNSSASSTALMASGSNSGDDNNVSNHDDHETGIEHQVNNLQDRSYVTVKQTAVNPYTYKLTLTIGRVQRADFGRYACLASNALGTGEARVVVREADLSLQQVSSEPPPITIVAVGQRDQKSGQAPRLSSTVVASRRHNNNRIVYERNGSSATAKLATLQSPLAIALTLLVIGTAIDRALHYFNV